MKFSIKLLLNSIHILLVCFLGQTFCQSCPPADTIHPCICDLANSQLICSGLQWFDLKQVMSKISSNGIKHFDEFDLTNSAITALEDNVFGDISFKKISITDAYKLALVGRWALNASAYTCEEFQQKGENELTDDNAVQLFEALSSLVIVNRIFLEFTKATKVPDNAFKIVLERQIRLESIHLNYIGGKYGSLETIGNKPFYYLDNLKSLSIANQPIKLLKAQAFDFEKPSASDFDLLLQATKVTGDSFEPGIFLNGNRPMTVELSFNNIEYLNENVFKPVFALPDDKMVTLILEGNPLVCDCKMEWMEKDKANLKYRVLEPHCFSTSKLLWDLTDKDFAYCHNTTKYQ